MFGLLRPRFSVVSALVIVAALFPQVLSTSSAFPIIPTIKKCLTTKYGAKVATGIQSAKKLSSKQMSQLKFCQNLTQNKVNPVNEAAGPSSNPGSPQPNQPSSGGGTISAIPPYANEGKAPLVDLTYGLLWTKSPDKRDFGNVADPTILQAADGSLRLFMVSGNELQVGITGIERRIRSFISRDNGRSWTLEDGNRLDTNNGVFISVRKAESGGYEAFGMEPPVTKIIRYTSMDGKDFRKVSESDVDPSLCKNKEGKAATSLGNDPQVVKTPSGYIGYVKSSSLINQPPWTKVACKIVSSDGTNWQVDPTGTIEIQNGSVTSNLGLIRTAAGQLQLYIPTFKDSNPNETGVLEIRISNDDGKTWGIPTSLGIQVGDPEPIELANGETLLSIGAFDARAGGAIMVLKKYPAKYKAARESKSEFATWRITGVTKDQVRIKNFCTDQDVSSEAIFEGKDGVLTVFYDDKKAISDPTLRSMSCFYAVIGPEQFIR